MPQQTFANGEQLASVRAKLNGNAADVETRFGDVTQSLELKADLVGGLVPAEQLPEFTPGDLTAIFIQADLGIALPATNPGSGRPWLDTSGLMRVGSGAGGTIPYIPSPTPSDGLVAIFDGLGGLKAIGPATFSGSIAAKNQLELSHDLAGVTRLEAEPTQAETRFINTYAGSASQAGWSFRNGSEPEVERAKISGIGEFLGQAFATAFAPGYDRRSRVQTSGWTSGHGNFISYLDSSGGCVEIGATFRSQAEVNFGGYCAATNPSELVYFYIGTYGAELMTLAPATGRVGIGTTSPQSQLEVYQQSAFISLQQPLPGTNGIRFGDGGVTRGQISVNGGTGEVQHTAGGSGSGGFHTFYTNGTEHFRITDDGAVGIGQLPASYNYFGSRCTIRQDQNYPTRQVIRNEHVGSAAAAEYTVNAAGNSWTMGMGSADNNANAFYIGKDVATGMAVAKYLGISATGKVGLSDAAAAPVYLLDLGSSIGDKLALFNNISSYFYGFGMDSGRMYAKAHNTECMTWEYTGHVGIGTTDPTTQLHVRSGGGSSPGGIRIENNNSDTWLSYPGDGRNYVRGTTILCDLGGSVKVGAGGVDPTYLLQVNGSTHLQNLRIPNTQSIAWGNSSGGFDWFTASVNSSNIFTLAANNAKLYLDAYTGYCGIGVVAPSSKLTVGDGTSDTRIHSQSGSRYAVRVSNGVGNGGYHFGATASLTTPDGVFSNHAGTERMRITDAGNLGVGTTNPTQRVDVAGTLKSTASMGLLVAPAASSESAFLRCDNSGGSTFIGMDNSTGTALTGTPYAAAINTAVALVCVIGGVVRSTLNANGEYINGDVVISGGGGFGRTLAVGIGGAVQKNSLAIFGHGFINNAPVLSLYRTASREWALAVVGGDLCFANSEGFANYQDGTLSAASSLQLRSTGEVTTTSSFDTLGATVGTSNHWQAKSQDVASGHFSLTSANTGHGMWMHSAGYLDTTFGYAIHTGAADPTVSDIASNSSLVWKNTTSGEVRHWVNDGGTLLKSAAYS